MNTVKLNNSEIKELLTEDKVEFPKYTTQILNLANQNAKGTAPKIVGQMSDLIQEFDGKTILEWDDWYRKRNPQAIDNAVVKVLEMVSKLKEAILLIDDELVKKWIEDLVILKTFTGLRFQNAILKKVAELKKSEYRESTPADEAKGIDGYIGDKPVSIKPKTYEYKKALNENITVDFIFYDKAKDGITIEYDF